MLQTERNRRGSPGWAIGAVIAMATVGAWSGPESVSLTPACIVGLAALAVWSITRTRGLDIERRQLEHKCNRATFLLDRTGTLAQVGAWRLDLRTNELEWSDFVHRIHETDPATFTPDVETAIDFYAPEARPTITAAIESGRVEGSPWDLELPLITATGRHIWVRAMGEPTMHDGECVMLSGAFQDITRERARHEEVETAMQRAEQFSRAKSEFLANMSHEIRTPMTAILGYAELLEAEGLDELDRHDYVRTIQRNGEHLLSLLNDILDLSKVEAGKMTLEHVEVSPQALVEEVLALMRVRAEAKELDLRAELPTSLPEAIRSDPVRLRQVLVNLVGNAIKFTEAGSVVIRVERETTIADDHPMLLFSVTDTGIGISAPDQDRLFDAFTQSDASTTRRFGGTGLGLAISRSLVERLGGTLQCESVLGQGTTMRLRLPVPNAEDVTWIQPDADRTEHLASGAERRDLHADDARSLDGVRILLAEDGLDNQRLISFILRKAGATVEVVENGRLAVERILGDGATEPGPPIDLVLMDIQMPEMDGCTATRELRAANFTRPIIALTAHAMSGDRGRYLEAGCSDYATKPVKRHALISLCELWTEQATPTPR